MHLQSWKSRQVQHRSAGRAVHDINFTDRLSFTVLQLSDFNIWNTIYQSSLCYGSLLLTVMTEQLSTQTENIPLHVVHIVALYDRAFTPIQIPCEVIANCHFNVLEFDLDWH